MPSSDQPTPSTPPAIPTPPSGAGASDLATDSTDPGELRELLERARERLSFYESFDRIIGENIRRSGELMVETVALREQAQTQAAEFARERAAFDATRQQDRDTYRTLVQSALTEVATTKISIESVMARLEGVLASLTDEALPGATSTTEALPDSEQPVAATSPLVEPPATDPAPLPTAPTPDIPDEVIEREPIVEEEAPAEPTGPRSIEMLVQNVPHAGMALSLQKHLRGLESVTSVGTREFAAGVLRLHIEATGEITGADLSSWLEEHSGNIRSTSPSVMEIEIAEAE